ncbi:MAG TPA: anthranilate synthase component I family protein [Thermoplasmata archaeon]|nr:anthranilate synthase component I family protein [Thermoplasmata archaeon]
MTLWERFVATAPDREVAGYFERAPNGTGRSGLAVSFDRADYVETLTRTTDLTDVSRRTERCLSGPRSAVMGYVGFDAVGLFEPALARFPAGSPFPLGELAFVREAHVARAEPPRRRPPRRIRPARPLRDSLPPGPFGRAVRHLVSGIRDGEAFQVVLAHRREWRRPVDLLARADHLRATERFAFFYYIKFGDREIVGATPESVVEVRGGRAYVNPIAGTLPTGPSRRGRLPLANDPKELAEHRMLVDLARNDLGSVSRPGSVRLVWEERRFRYARLEHLVSRVGGRLRSDVGPWNALAAAFPAGTVSGAPKIRATELLRREERTWRGPYAGTVALLRPHDHADFALTIRSGFAAGRRLYTAAGAGIVHRSQPVREFDETLSKLAHVEATLVAGDP